MKITGKAYITMAFIESYRQDKKKKEAAASGVPEKDPNRPSEERKNLKDILKNKEESRLFGIYLNELGEDELVQKLATGNLKEEEFDALDEKRNDFLDLMAEVKMVQESLDLKSIEESISLSPALEKIEGHAGADGIRDAILKGLPEMAITNPDHFEDLQEKLMLLADSKSRITETDKKIEEFCKKYNITTKDYKEALESGNSQGALMDLIGNIKEPAFRFWEKKKYKEGDLFNLAEEGEKKDEIDSQIKELDKNFELLAGVLRGIVVENDAVRSAFTANLIGEKTSAKEDAGTFPRMKDFVKISLADAKKAWEEYEKKHKGDPGFSAGAAREEFFSNYASENVTKKKGGFFSIANRFFGAMLEDMIKF